MKNRITDYLPSLWRRESTGEAGEETFSRQDIAGLLEPVEELVRKYPAASLGAAFAVGVALAWWIKRR